MLALRLLLGFGWNHPGLVIWGGWQEGTSWNCCEEEVNGSESDEPLWSELRSQ